MSGRLDWRLRALLATAVVGITLGAVVAALTIDAPPRTRTRVSASPVTAQVVPPVRLPDVKLPAAEPPPEPTGADFAARPANPPTASAAPAAPPAPAAEAATPTAPADWATVPIDELRTRANANELAAMEELARRLIQGAGVAKDPQAGAGWLLRAAEGGSAQAAFNVGVMYERGFVVERDSSRAAEWYRKAVDGNMPAAKHNLALLLRDGKGAPRDTKRAIELLQSAARQGMAASMFSLGDMYERGDSGARDPASALAWFAIAAEFERQINHGEDTALARTADQRALALQSVLTPNELKRAQQMGQTEFRAIADALAPPKASPPASDPAPASAEASPSAPPTVDLPSWPKAASEQVRAIQQALVDLRLLRDKPDGMLGPMTRNAIRDFERSVGLKETGDPSKEVYVAMRAAQAKREIEAKSPLPMPPKQEAAPSEPSKAEPTKAEPAKSEPAQRTGKSQPVAASVVLDLGKPEPPPSPPTSTDIARSTADSDIWPANGSEQIKAIQRLLRDLKILADPVDGQLGDKTRSAIRDYQRLAGLQETGEASKALFDSLKETRALMARKTDQN
jgi:peptidoglycan hydrolase-like protein with peptidoglycan-binding domain